MARRGRETREPLGSPGGDGRSVQERRIGDESIPELLRQLVDDVSDLVRSEIALAKAELRQTGRDVTANLVKIGIAAGLAAVGGLALTAFLILALGSLMAGAYWASALIVAVVYLAVGGLLMRRAVAGLSPQELKPDETVRSLREDKELAKREARELRRDIRA